ACVPARALVDVLPVGDAEPARSRAGHVRGASIEDAAADDLGALTLDLRMKDGSVVGSGEYRVSDIEPDLARVDIDAEHEVDIPCPVTADVRLDQTARGTGASIKRRALHQRAGAVSDSDHRNFNRFHQHSLFPRGFTARSRARSGKDATCGPPSRAAADLTALTE